MTHARSPGKSQLNTQITIPDNNHSFTNYSSLHQSPMWPLFDSESTKISPTCPYVLCKNVLGTGSYANVYECKNKVTGRHYAAKQFAKKLIYGMELALQREFEVLKSILKAHPNILLMIDYFETPEYFYLVTDLAVGGELFQRITRNGHLSVSETKRILSVLLSALKHLHSNNIVHRDVKAENILFLSKNSDPTLLLLADFGQARILHDGKKAASVEGTLSYLAPEVLARTGHSFPVDIWAVGVLTYFMLCGYMPFDCDTDEETKSLIATADYIFEPTEYWVNVPQLAKDFISACLRLDPNERLTAQQALDHPFLSLKPVFSYNSLQQLQDAMWRLLQSRQRSSVNLSRPDSGSLSCSLERLGHTLMGEKCYSPETVTNLTTPVDLAMGSRQASRTSLALQKMTDVTKRVNHANFVL